MKHFARRGAALAAALTLLAAGCGDDDSGSAETDASVEMVAPVGTEASVETDAPVETGGPADTGAPQETEAAADADLRIVSLSVVHTETLFAIGADDQIVAVDEQSDYPEEALDLPRDLSGFEPDVEAIAAYEPDLVVIGGDFTGLGEQLADIGIDTWDGPAATTVDDTYLQIRELGELTGESENAEALVAEMQAEIDEVLATVPDVDEPLSVYHELDPTLFSVTSDTFIGQAYRAVGLRNVADEVETDAGGYPQLNAEFLVSANPDLIVINDCCGETPDTVAARPGWESIAAVQDGNIVVIDQDISSRWGPRTVDFFVAVVDAVNELVAS